MGKKDQNKNTEKQKVKDSLLIELNLMSTKLQTNLENNIISDSDLLMFGYLKKKYDISAEEFKEHFFDGVGDGGADLVFPEQNIIIQTKTNIDNFSNLSSTVTKMAYLLINGFMKIKKNFLGNELINDDVFDNLVNLDWEEPITFIISGKEFKFEKETVIETLKAQILSVIKKAIINDVPDDVFEKINIELISWEEIYSLFKNDITNEYRFSIDSNNLLYNKNPNLNNNNLSGFVTNIGIIDLYKAYKKYGNSLFDLNVRNFTKTKSNSSISNIVNNDITKTLEKNNDLMWFMNNGIVILCNDFYILNNQLRISNFSIINGAQTVTNIFHFLAKKYENYEENKKEIVTLLNTNIIAKIIKRPSGDKIDQNSFLVSNLEEDISNFSKQIVKTTNNQKPISNWTFFYDDEQVLEIKNVLDKRKYLLINKEGFIDNKEKVKYKDNILELPEYTQLSKAIFNLTPGLAMQRKTKLFNKTINNDTEEFKKTLDIIANDLDNNSIGAFEIKKWFNKNLINKNNFLENEIKQIKRFRFWIYSLLSLFSLKEDSFNNLKELIISNDEYSSSNFASLLSNFVKKEAKWDFNQLKNPDLKTQILDIIRDLIQETLNDSNSKFNKLSELYKDNNFYEWIKRINNLF